MRKYRIVLSFALLSLMAGLLVFTEATHRQTQLAQPANAAQFLRLNIPALTHGFEKTAQLPDGDLFLQSVPLQMAVDNPPEGAKTFPVKLDTFGGDAQSIGALPTTEPQGLAFSTPNSKVVARACAESIWDSNLMIAATSGTFGDTVRLFLENTDGTEAHQLALFTVKSAGVELTRMHQDLMLYVDDRYATGPMVKEGSLIAFGASAGESGLRTNLLTFSWPMKGFSPLQGCYRIGVEIARADNFGTTSVVFTDIVVNRNRVTGDENNAGAGLLRRLRGGFPTGLPCKAECPFPAEPPTPQIPNIGIGGTGDECNAICYRSPQYFKLNIDRLPHGTVVIGGVNFNRPVSTTNKRAMGLALAGGYTPMQKFNQEFVTAQLNVLLAGGDGSAKVFYAMEGKLSCYGLKFDEVTLTNGFVISPDTQLKDLYQQGRFCINNNSAADQIALTAIFDLLNGNNPLGVCNNEW